VLDPDAALKVTEVRLGVSVPPVLDEPNVKETLMVPVVAGLLEVRVTVAVYVTPASIPAVWPTARDTVVGVVDPPVTFSQLGPGWLVPVYAVAVVNVIGVVPSELETGTPVAWFPSATTAVPLLPFRTNVCARPGTTMRSAIARNRTVLLKCL
jgi:hypothetical protein